MHMLLPPRFQPQHLSKQPCTAKMPSESGSFDTVLYSGVLFSSVAGVVFLLLQALFPLRDFLLLLILLSFPFLSYPQTGHRLYPYWLTENPLE